ncbi:MAG: glycoside hydrolase [Alphaproteobacteria bacterium]|nr:glycoside hydrolase [Alphaproteobacteria bacterium]MDE2111374.1 glycoside hydrolase [Alphaproteobacteria bacterium]MDE2495573.1 glycoside hydrolase [Alphaproteobacteria bacterium]
MSRFGIVSALMAAVVATGVSAQDMRTVTEPVIPPSCTVLDAQLTSVKDGPYDTLAPADESKLDTQRIQNALDSCPKGKAVELRPQGAADAFLSGPLELRDGVTLLIDKGATLFASIDPKLFENAPGSCGIVSDQRGPGCKPLISVDRVTGAAIMGDGVIDGRGGIKLLGRDVSAWDLAQQALAGKRQQVSRLIVANHADDFTLYRITLKNSPNFHVTYNAGDGFTVWGVKIDTPHRVPRSAHPLARNTDGIDPGNGSKNVTITHSYIRDGDDNVAIKGGRGGVAHMTVSHDHFYWGHGMSIGSETYGGVGEVRVFDLTLDGTDAGIRIKSAANRGGLVHDVVYDDICIRNSAHPIDMSMAYDNDGASSAGVRLPVFRDITLHDVAIAGGGGIVFDGYDHAHRVQAVLDGVYLTDAADPAERYAYTFDHADVTYGPGGSNIALPAGDDAAITGAPAKGESGSPSCAGRFVPFPE